MQVYLIIISNHNSMKKEEKEILNKKRKMINEKEIRKMKEQGNKK